jgi:hypothetical protein
MKRGCPDEDGQGGPKRLNNGKDRAKPLSRRPPPPVEEKEEPDENGGSSVRTAIKTSLEEMRRVSDAAITQVKYEINLVLRDTAQIKNFLRVSASEYGFSLRQFGEMHDSEVKIAADMARLSDIHERISRGFDLDCNFEPNSLDVYVVGDVDVSQHPPRTKLAFTDYDAYLQFWDLATSVRLIMDESNDSRNPYIPEYKSSIGTKYDVLDRWGHPYPKTDIDDVQCKEELPLEGEPMPPNLPSNSNIDPSRPRGPESDE